MNVPRMAAMARKDLLEVRRSPGILAPVLVMLVVTIAIPFVIAVGVPHFTGDRLEEDADFRRALAIATRSLPELGQVEAEAAIQAFVFQQFFLFLVLVPVTASMTLASHSIIGEKQNRSLEPLLATPLTTTELLLAKVAAAILPAIALEILAVLIYLGGIALFGLPGVAGVLVSGRMALVAGLIGPLAALVALQLAVISSSRVNDPRSAQQIGVLVILPIIGVVVAQFAGVFWLGAAQILTASAILIVLWLGLLLAGVRLFGRERILTRWR